MLVLTLNLSRRVPTGHLRAGSRDRRVSDDDLPVHQVLPVHARPGAPGRPGVRNALRARHDLREPLLPQTPRGGVGTDSDGLFDGRRHLPHRPDPHVEVQVPRVRVVGQDRRLHHPGHDDNRRAHPQRASASSTRRHLAAVRLHATRVHTDHGGHLLHDLGPIYAVLLPAPIRPGSGYGP